MKLRSKMSPSLGRLPRGLHERRPSLLLWPPLCWYLTHNWAPTMLSAALSGESALSLCLHGDPCHCWTPIAPLRASSGVLVVRSCPGLWQSLSHLWVSIQSVVCTQVFAHRVVIIYIYLSFKIIASYLWEEMRGIVSQILTPYYFIIVVMLPLIFKLQMFSYWGQGGTQS